MQIDVDALAALRRFVARYETQRQAAEALGFTQAYLSDLLKEQRPFSDNVLAKLGLRRTIIVNAETRRRKTDTTEELAS
jgi:predicted transcriptional regulator